MSWAKTSDGAKPATPLREIAGGGELTQNSLDTRRRDIGGSGRQTTPLCRELPTL
jgi:hypothetical protein